MNDRILLQAFVRLTPANHRNLEHGRTLSTKACR
jgi:hypothetical protein